MTTEAFSIKWLLPIKNTVSPGINLFIFFISDTNELTQPKSSTMDFFCFNNFLLLIVIITFYFIMICTSCFLKVLSKNLFTRLLVFIMILVIISESIK